MEKKGVIYLIFLIVCASSTGQVPKWDWVKILHTNMMEVSHDVVADPVTGNVYMAGYWGGPLEGFIPGGGRPSTDFSTTYGEDDCLVVKFDPSGNILWAFKIGGEGDDDIHCIHIDIDGNIYVTGSASQGRLLWQRLEGYSQRMKITIDEAMTPGMSVGNYSARVTDNHQDRIIVGYSYDVSTGYTQYIAGTNELFLGYNFPLNRANILSSRRL